jgi:hypothetical protein
MANTINILPTDSFSDDAKGLEKVISTSVKTIFKIQEGIDQVIYGKQIPKDKKPKNPLDYGLMKILDIMSSIDFCDIVNYGISKIGNQSNKKSQFDPNKPPEKDASKLDIQKFKLQKLAYEIQLLIDGIPNDLDSIPIDSKKEKLFTIIQNINVLFNTIQTEITPEVNEIQSMTGFSLTTAFPTLKKILGGFEDKLTFLNKWKGYRQIPISDFQKILNLLDKIKLYCIIIQGLSSPADIVKFGVSTFNSTAQSSIKKIQDFIDPARAIPLLKSMIQVVSKLNLLIGNILRIVSLSQAVVKILTLLVSIFKKIQVFFLALPMPNAFTTVGITTTFSDKFKSLLKEKGTDNFTKRLSQINILLSLLYNFCSSLSIVLFDIIEKLKTIIANLDQCSNVNKDIINDLQNQINKLESNKKQLDTFIATKNASNNTSKAKTAGKYTIYIITEEFVNTTFKLRRRYGVAIDNNKQIILSSTPTFASDDAIIIAEIKQLLSAKGLIKNQTSDYSILEQEIINEATSYLEENDINWDIVSTFDDGLDTPDNENDDSGLGLNSFFNKLQGGKALRKRVRKINIENNQKLVSDLKNIDSKGKYTSNIIKNTESDTNKIKLQELEEEKRKLKIALAISKNPITISEILKKIKAIDNQIEILKK